MNESRENSDKMELALMMNPTRVQKKKKSKTIGQLRNTFTNPALRILSNGLKKWQIPSKNLLTATASVMFH